MYYAFARENNVKEEIYVMYFHLQVLCSKELHFEIRKHNPKHKSKWVLFDCISLMNIKGIVSQNMDFHKCLVNPLSSA